MFKYVVITSMSLIYLQFEMKFSFVHISVIYTFVLIIMLQNLLEDV